MALHPLSVALVAAHVFFGSACSSGSPSIPEGQNCEKQRTHLLAVLGKLPTEVHGLDVKTALPTAAINGEFKKGHLLELTGDSLRLAGVDISGSSNSERVAELSRHLQRQALSGTLLVAAAPQTDVRALHEVLEALPPALKPRLLFARPLSQGGAASGKLSEALELPERVLVERNPEKRAQLSRQCYEQFARCPLTRAASDEALGLAPQERWPALARSMPPAIKACPCAGLTPGPLRRLLVAEQRAGTALMGSVSAAFLADIRCRASMPLRSVQQVLDDIDDFDAEFSGELQSETLVFGKAVTDARLLVYLCNAMAGDLLSEIQRDGRSLFFRAPGKTECEQWRMTAMARGAPMGSLARVHKNTSERFHFRQAGNDIRLFGPAPNKRSRATDNASWPCDEEFHLGDVGESEISVTDNGAWFFTRPACEAAPDTSFRSCIHAPPAKPNEREPAPASNLPRPGKEARSP